MNKRINRFIKTPKIIYNIKNDKNIYLYFNDNYFNIKILNIQFDYKDKYSIYCKMIILINKKIYEYSIYSNRIEISKILEHYIKLKKW